MTYMRGGFWTAQPRMCRDCGMRDLPIEGGARCPYCYELWLIVTKRDDYWPSLHDTNLYANAEYQAAWLDAEQYQVKA